MKIVFNLFLVLHKGVKSQFNKIFYTYHNSFISYVAIEAFFVTLVTHLTSPVAGFVLIHPN